ncbi:MFS transporter [Levyella massiliensis]|uniref:MFS transporter n=1 Tax=Levyella massiliensis TaxID=938289 RepID=UPI00399C4753
MLSLLLPIIYLSFISLGLPDALLGAAWPTLYLSLDVPLSYAGIISMIISGGTIFSSLQSDRLNRRYGTGRITFSSVLLTAVALLVFSFSRSFLALCLWAIPYGLGAGSVDAALNNYVALHYKSQHMNWLHCMWGIGAALGPMLMGMCLTHGLGWPAGYRLVAGVQFALTAILFFRLPLWKKAAMEETAAASAGHVATADAAQATEHATTAATSATEHAPSTVTPAPLSLKQIFALPGAKEIFLCFFCYSALEATIGLWASSYLSLFAGMDAKTAAGRAALFYVGITGGRALSGFLAQKWDDDRMIRLGQGIVAMGLFCLFVAMLCSTCSDGSSPFLLLLTQFGFLLLGLGCAPIYPGIIHSTPARFGTARSQAMIGVQMASAYVGSCFLPPLFGVLARCYSVALLPFYALLLLGIMFTMHQLLLHRSTKD